jgi:hypothetical protein
VRAGARKREGLIFEAASSAGAIAATRRRNKLLSRPLKIGIYIALGLLVFVLQFALAYKEPSLGLWSPFPYSVLRNVEMPIMLAVCGAVGAFSAKSLVERMLFYSVTAASLAEIVVIKAMLWIGQPWLMLAVFFLNAFMTVQFLRYGILVSAMNRSETD